MSTLSLPNSRGKFGREIATDYNEINLQETNEAKQAKLEMWIAKRIGDDLIKHFKGREWGVRVDIAGQVIIITCDSLSCEKGFHIHMAGRNIHDLQLKARSAAGEILERHGVSTGRKADPELFESLNRDLRDNVIATDSKATLI